MRRDSFALATGLLAVALIHTNGQMIRRDLTVVDSAVVVARGSSVSTQLGHGFAANEVRVGSVIYLRVVAPVFVANQLAIPAGVVIEARVDSVAQRDAERVDFGLRLTRVIYPRRGIAAVRAEPNDFGVDVTTSIPLRDRDGVLALGTPAQLNVRRDLSVDIRLIGGFNSRRAESSVLECYVPGTPSTPNVVIPGTPGTPAIGDFPAIPGTPDILVPGMPDIPGYWELCR